METSQNKDASEITLLVERYQDLSERGVTISIDELCKDCPSLATAVGQEIAAIQRVDRVLVAHQESESGLTAAQPGKRSGATSTNTDYLIQRFVASGGFSEVYLAEDTQLQRKVAIKFPRPEFEDSANYQERLAREALITSKLDHPGVVAVYAQGEGEQGTPFYAMRYIEGDVLSTRIASFHSEDRTIASPAGRRLLSHFVSVCRTIAFAHERGIIHRDIKPDNIVLGKFGESYVLDWGLAKVLASTGEAEQLDCELVGAIDNRTELTIAGNILGSPAFMSPEQARGESVGPATDIFGLGSTLYYILFGASPYRANSLPEVLAQARIGLTFQDQPEQPVPKSILAIQRKAMAPHPNARYESATELADEVERFLSNDRVNAHQENLFESNSRWLHNNRKLASGVLVCAFLIMAVLSVATVMLSSANSSLTLKQAESDRLRTKAENAFAAAQESLYIQNIALVESEIRKNNIYRARQLLDTCPPEYRNLEWHLLESIVSKHTPHQSFTTPGTRCTDCDFSQDGQILACYLDNHKIRVYRWPTDLTTAEPNYFELEADMTVEVIRTSPGGNLLFAGGFGRRDNRSCGLMKVWDLERRKIIASRNLSRREYILSAAWSGDGSQIATGGGSGKIRIRDPLTLEPLFRINAAHSGAVSSLVYTPLDETSTRRLLSAGADGDLKTWLQEHSPANENESTIEFTLIDKQRAHDGEIHTLNTKQRLAVSGGKDKLVRVWQISESGIEKQRDLVGHSDQVQSIAVSPNGRLIASAGYDGIVQVWSPTEPDALATIKFHTSHINKLTFSPDGTWLLSAGDEGGIHVWRVSSFAGASPTGMIVNFTTEYLVANSEDQLCVWDVGNTSPVARISSDSDFTAIASAHLSPKYVACHKNCEAILHSAGAQSSELETDGKIADAALFSADDKIIFLGHRDGRVSRLDLETGNSIRSPDLKQRVVALELSNDETTLAVQFANSGVVRLLDSETLEKLANIQADPDAILGISASPSQAIFATTGLGGVAKVWSFADQALLMEFDIGASWANCLCFSPDGSRLVVGSEHSVLVWDVNLNRELLSMSISRCVHSMAFSKDGQFLAVGGESPRVRIWRVAADKTLAP